MSASPPMDDSTPRKRRTWLAALGINSLALSILLHVLFGIGATYLIVEHFQKKHINFHATEPPAPHTEVEHKVQVAKRNNVESAPPDLKRIVTTALSPVSLPDVPVSSADTEMEPSPISGIDGVVGMGVDGGLGGGDESGGGSPLFGATDGNGLKGTFYDLKQTPNRQPTGLQYNNFYEKLRAFVDAGWKTELLDQYYKSATPLYSTIFAIPVITSAKAPAAYKVENEVKPSYWAAHYKGVVSAPETGDYRFMGYGDNVLIVRINGHLVLDAGWNTILPDHPELSHHFPLNWIGSKKGLPNFDLKMGPPFHMDAGQPVPMEVLIGDDGGECGFFLFVMKVGDSYEKGPDGTPKLPFFELGASDPPDFSETDIRPPFSPKAEPWEDCETDTSDDANPAH